MRKNLEALNEQEGWYDILAICMSCELFTRLAPSRFVVSPLCLSGGCITCALEILPVPAPAVRELLGGISVRSFPGEDETVTPTFKYPVAVAEQVIRSYGAFYKVGDQRSP
jgi:hypothetical protein